MSGKLAHLKEYSRMKLPIVRIISEDNQTFELDADTAKMSGVLKERLDNLNGACRLEDLRVPYRGDIIKRIVDFCVFHKDDPPRAEDPEEYYKAVEYVDLCEYDLQFLSIDSPTLFAIMNLSNLLRIMGLLNLCCYHMARITDGRTDEEIRQVFKFSAEDAQLLPTNNGNGH